MTTHHVKSWPRFYQPIAEGVKTFDIRKDDRGYAVGDDIVMEEFRPGVGEYTGEKLTRRIVYILRDFEGGLMPDYCILGLTNEGG
jgi:hypothetical protein